MSSTNVLRAFAATVSILGCSWSASAGSVSIQTTLIGNPGNAGDTVDMGGGLTGFGAVAYEFEIGIQEVTNTEYAAFLNAIAASDPNGLYNTSMGVSSRGGILRAGSSGSYTYSVKPGFENRPVIYVSFNDAARFVNWLHNSQPTGAQNDDSTEDGAYTFIDAQLIGAGDIDGNGRNSAWLWALPSEHEWHKAAYGNAGDTYTVFATQSNSTPVSEAPPGGTNSANWRNAVSSPPLSIVGAYVNSPSFWGTYDQNGNVQEFNEGAVAFSEHQRRIRGGHWSTQTDSALRSHQRGGTSINGIGELDTAGFRVVKRIIPQGAGACCLSPGNCMDVAGQSECDSMSGVFEGVGTLCASSACGLPVGACCMSDGFCTEPLNAMDCETTGGLYMGDDTTCAAIMCLPAAPRLYVDGSTRGGGNGASWATAFNDLQDALTLANAFPSVVDEIWVAAGIYLPDQGSMDRTMSFLVANDVAVYGGFAGNETQLAERDIQANPTILSADLLQDDADVECCHATFLENAYHVVIVENTTSAAILDGFRIQDGQADGRPDQNVFTERLRGAGIYVDNAVLIVRNCEFIDNRAAKHGGAIFCDSADITVQSCLFENNRAEDGNQQPSGGAIYCLESSSDISQCDFLDNVAGLYGGAMHHATGSSATLSTCLFRGNYASIGGALFNFEADAVIDGCVFDHNEAPVQSVVDYAGAMAHVFGTIEMSNCNVINHETMTRGAIQLSNTSGTLSDCTFSDNQAGSDGAAISIQAESEITVERCTFDNNACDNWGGAVYIDFTSKPTFVQCSFTANESALWGGAVHDRSFESGLFDRCTFTQNHAPDGGAIYGLSWNTTYANCLFVGNSATNNGGAVEVFASNIQPMPMFVNCTFVANAAGGLGGGIHCNSMKALAQPQLHNTILWNNTDVNGIGSSSQINDAQGGSTIQYCCIKNYSGGGVGNTSANPSFTDPDGADNDPNTFDDNDYTLLSDSPCIDAADNSAVPAGILLDLADNDRFLDDLNVPDTGNGTAPIVDMGAYEFGSPAQPTCPGDLTGPGGNPDGLVNVTDLFTLLAAWNTNGPGADLALPFDIVNVSDLFALLAVWGDCP